jgi:V/A-type H+-transporting ATPase subunit E
LDSAKTRAASQSRQSILKAKQEVLAQVFQKALDDLSKLPEKEYRDLLLNVLMKRAQGGEDVLVGQDDGERLGEGFLDAVNAALAKSGKAPVRLLFMEGSLGGGFILRRGKISANMTFPAALKKLEDELEIEIAGILFPDGT